MGHLQKMYNFTWNPTKDPNGDWGTVPISGPANSNGTYGGIFGSVIDQTVQLSVSSWQIGAERLTFLDYAQNYPPSKAF